MLSECHGGEVEHRVLAERGQDLRQGGTFAVEATGASEVGQGRLHLAAGGRQRSG